jgi:hypothetical protein
MIDSGGNNLVFLLSTPRAGSTLVSAILTNHSRVYCPNEPWLLLGFHAWYKGGNLTQAPYEHSGVETALREFLSEEDFLEATRAFAVEAYNRKLAAQGKSVFVDKTPRYYHILPFVENLFPAAKKVWLQRNPLDVAASYQASWQLSVDQLFDPQFGPMCLDLTVGLSRLAAFFQGQPQTFTLRYEDVVRQPEAVLPKLCAFLGLDYEPGIENYGSNPQALAERKNRRMGDPSVFAHTRPHAQSIDRWQTALTAAQVQRMLDCIGTRFFERMGYPDTVGQLRDRGFRFPEQSAVDENLKRFENAAQSLPWAHRDRDRAHQLEVLCNELRAECDRLKDNPRKSKSRPKRTGSEPGVSSARFPGTIFRRLTRWWAGADRGPEA